MHIPSHAFKKSVARVGITYHQTARSPLTQEVRPEDVVDPKKHGKDWMEMDDNDYDGDYNASTDPIHPVSTDYSHPLDDDDGSWILNHFSPEEMESAAGDLDFDQNGWSWDNNDNDNDNDSDSEKGGTPTIAKSREENTTSQISDNDLIAWGPEASASSMLSKVSMDGLSMEQKHAKEQKELIIDAFWAVVNESTEPQQQSDSKMEDVNVILRSLEISHNTSTPSAPCTPTKSPHMWIDGPSDAHTPPSTPIRPTTPPNPNSTRTAYNKQRKFLKKRLQEDANKNKYYSDLLLISRWEAKASEGPEGRFIAEPQMVRAGGGGGGVGGNGWFQ
ncbi:hypothetical protein J4E81_002097 [Alternaria sp. BMP 2799]|nr:hypothetical protein J4E81_002097 [Alternaria sp. BMP 2799]